MSKLKITSNQNIRVATITSNKVSKKNYIKKNNKAKKEKMIVFFPEIRLIKKILHPGNPSPTQIFKTSPSI